MDSVDEMILNTTQFSKKQLKLILVTYITMYKQNGNMSICNFEIKFREFLFSKESYNLDPGPQSWEVLAHFW